MTTGIVKWVNESKGFGLIAPDGGGKDLFARFWALHSGDTCRSVKEKQRVSFEAMVGPDGDQAVNIKVLES